MAAAQIKMKALVVARLLMGDITNWATFESERKTAGQIANRRTARSVSSQIGRSYRELSTEIQNFIGKNFARCEYSDLARLCDEVNVGSGISLRLEEFEKQFFPLAESVKGRVPFYTHVRISTYGLQFEFPEHHFLRDMETSLPELLEVQSRLAPFAGPEFDSNCERDLVARLVAKQNFLSRSIVSASFSLAEAFLSGLFFTAVHTKSIGRLACDEDFLNFAQTKESASLRDRLDRVVRFASNGAENVTDEPFKAFIEVGKRYRDAIHHTTPFQRKDIEPGGRLTALYEINGDIALRCVVRASETILRISHWTNPASDTTDVAIRCGELIQKADATLAERLAAAKAA
ncbi:MAG: hypothetical protein ACYC8V_07390 [Caulobacteraceae bacterium]